MMELPQHLRKYIVEQNYAKYTPRDHAVWRYVLRQLKNFLKTHAHESYLEGLEKTGIEVEKIPSIESISQKLQKFGWRALPVSGFIPPAAFMELQSLGVLPIASDMRSIDHLLYTPAPDIVHEAAGHAPILIHPEYAEYLRQYAQVARKSILSRQDLEQYEAIRDLSDLKENSNSTPEQIKQAEKKLAEVSKSIDFISEAAELSRMNWWTAEYGLIGPMDNPKIIGAGLLSSVGEAKWCLSEKVKKLPLTLECIRQGYDITEPQPQLFVAKDFKSMVDVLHQMAQTMAFKVGGRYGLEKAIQAESVNTSLLDSGLQISGVHKNYLLDDSGVVAYLQFSGPTQISYKDHEIDGHGKSYHKEGYGTPIGEILSPALKDLVIGENTVFKYKSGVQVSGRLEKILKASETATILTFSQATATFKSDILFQPAWGAYDVVLGHSVTSVFGGPADRVAFGETDDFVATQVAKPIYSDEQKKLFSFYEKVRALRQNNAPQDLVPLMTELKNTFPNEWLLFVELLEISFLNHSEEAIKLNLTTHLNQLVTQNPLSADVIQEGVKLAHAIT